MESMAKQLEAHLHEEFKLWSCVVLCQKQIMNARMKAKREIYMKNSRGCQLFDTFGALPGVHLMHTICRLESQEVNNPMLQTVHESELK